MHCDGKAVTSEAAIVVQVGEVPRWSMHVSRVLPWEADQLAALPNLREHIFGQFGLQHERYRDIPFDISPLLRIKTDEDTV